LFVGLLPPSLSDSDNPAEITIRIDPPIEDFEDVQNEEDEKSNENTNNGGSGNGPTSFVTGSNYALNGIPILINSPEGLKLNDQLIDQQELEKLESIHGEKFWERVDQLTYDHYGLANAMFDPNTSNSYFSNGGKHSQNVNSNFEYYVLERGYDPRDPSKVPNKIFAPTKYDLAREIMQKLDDPNANNLDLDTLNDLNLNLLSPNAFQMTEEQENIIYHKDVENRAMSILQNSLPSISSDSSSDSSSDGQNSQNENSNQKDNPISSMPNNGNKALQLQTPSPINEEMFQNTEHIKNLISQDNFQPKYNTQDEFLFPIFEIFFVIIFFSISTVIGLFVIKKFRNKALPVEITVKQVSEFDYLKETKFLLESALTLYKSKQTKNAYERFSQSIRFYYSYKYNLKREVTTFEILEQIQKTSDSEYRVIYDCLALCGIIEFAKHHENENDFQTCLSLFSNILDMELEQTSKNGTSL